MRRKIDLAGAGPVYVAILPAAAELEAGGSPDGVLQAIHDALGRKGTYAAVIGNHFRAGSDVLPPGVAGRLATEALAEHRGEGVTPTLLDFVDRVAAERSGSGGGDGSGGQPSGGGGVVIGLLIAGVVAFLGFRAIRSRRRSQAELAEVKAAAHEDLIALADDVQKLEQPVESNAQAKQEYTQALDFYDQASGAYDRVTQPRQLEAVTSALEEGRWHMSSAEALLEGRNPARAAPTLLLRSAPRPLGARRRVDATWRNAEKGSGVRSGRTGGGARHAARVTRGDGGRPAGPLLERPAVLRPVGGWLLHAVRRDGVPLRPLRRGAAGRCVRRLGLRQLGRRGHCRRIRQLERWRRRRQVAATSAGE